MHTPPLTLTNPSPNHNDRRGQDVQVIVLHADASPNERGCLSWIQSRDSKVSYHALIGRDGSIYTCVPWSRRAWHSGKAEWNGHKDVNGISVGIAFSNRNDGIEALTLAQVESMRALIAHLRKKFGALPVTTHAAIAPGRKTDPDKAPGFKLSDYA
jgi:N-acetylmuramoyl-L-alanine amidase